MSKRVRLVVVLGLLVLLVSWGGVQAGEAKAFGRWVSVRMSAVVLEFSTSAEKGEELAAALVKDPPASVAEARKALEDAEVSLLGSAVVWVSEEEPAEFELGQQVAVPHKWVGEPGEETVTTSMRMAGVEGTVSIVGPKPGQDRLLLNYSVEVTSLRVGLPEGRGLVTLNLRGSAVAQVGRGLSLVATTRVALTPPEEEEEEASEQRLVGVLILLQPEEVVSYSIP